MARSLGTYNEEIIRKFYTSYAAIIKGSISKRAKPTNQPQVEAILVRGFSMDISKTTLRKFIYGLDQTLPINTTELDYHIGIIWSGAF
ncbi:hypothetical protein R3W88_033640 [Solanum pinnatisectum]|uniref:Uncharacterized protein n=1 Tax=Solanum pinnatisectum TaxID=50273 RepID=A0AAV9K0I9_9SOLN|nr:hypothetical protein R3W88_033640 [Solanum pinnatisectum]